MIETRGFVKRDPVAYFGRSCGKSPLQSVDLKCLNISASPAGDSAEEITEDLFFGGAFRCVDPDPGTRKNVNRINGDSGPAGVSVYVLME